MSVRPPTVTATDVALLRYLAQEGSIVAASRRAGISRDRANYRLGRLEVAFGGAPVISERGGRGHGTSRLTALGDRIVRQGFEAVELIEAHPTAPLFPSNLLHGTFRSAPGPTVTAPDGVRFRVAFSADEGERVALVLDPESILIARRRFPSSARNVLAGTVEKVLRGGVSPSITLIVRVGKLPLRVAVTEEPVREMRLARGARIWLYIKATALRRVGAREAPSRRSNRRTPVKRSRTGSQRPSRTARRARWVTYRRGR